MNLFSLVAGVTRVLSTLTLVGGILVVGALFGMILLRLRPTIALSQRFNRAFTYIGQKGSWFILLVSGLATLGSLFYSEVAHFVPCVLCWYQRIAMYPIVLTAIIALRRHDKKDWIFTLPAAIIGAAIALYHYIIQVISTFATVPDAFLPCSTVGMTPSCTSSHFMMYGYITIPMMALTAFALILIIVWCMRREGKTLSHSSN
jgi:disulfide bond formation protein DsbB